jgi:hypothetical protein
MAQVPNSNVQDVLPDARPPDDYQRVQSSPADFGGSIAQGMEQFGKQTSAAAQHWGEIQVDDLTNNYQRQSNDLVENYKKLRGSDALNAQESVKDQLYTLYDKTKNQLATSDQIQAFDRTNRPYTDRYLIGNLNTHANQQADQFGVQTANDGLLNTHSLAANAGASSNESFALVQYHRAVEFENKKLTLYGQESDPEAKKAAVQRAGATLKTYFEALAVEQPQKAFEDVDRFRSELGPLWAPLKKQLKNSSDHAVALGAVADSEKAVADGYDHTTRVSAPAAAVGDSTADGVKTAGGLTGDTLVGRPSRAVVASIRDMPQAPAPGARLVIGTGVMNDAGPNADLTKVNLAVVADQIDAAKSKHYTPVILGVGDKYAALNPQLQKLAEAKGAQFVPLGPNDGTHPTGDSYKSIAASVGGGGGQQQTGAAPAGRYSGDQLFNAFYGQESGGGANTTTSIDNAHGDMQITPGTFAQFAKPGERLDNRADNIAVGKRILDYYSQKYNGDAARVAVAYFSGEGNVAPAGSPTPWKENRHDGQGTYVSQYVNGILGRLKAPGIATGPNNPAPQPLGHGSLTASGTIARPGWEGASGPDTEPAPAPPITPASYDPAAMIAPPAPNGVNPAERTPEDLLAAQVSWIQNNPAYTPEQKDMAIREAKVNYQTRLIEFEQNQQAKKVIKDRIANEYQGFINKGDPQAYKTLVNDPRLNDDEVLRATLMERFKSKLGVEDQISFGSGYDDARRRLLLPRNDPDHLGSVQQIMQMTNDKLLNPKGESELIKAYNELSVGKTSFGFQARINGTLEKAKRYFSYDNPAIHIKNDKGLDMYDQKFLNAFYDQLDAWKNDGKNDPNKFPLFDDKTLEAQMQALWPKNEKNKYYMNAVGEQLGEKPDLPAAPEGANQPYWISLMSNPPLKGGVPIKPEVWSAFVNELIKNPTPEFAARWDAHMKNTDIRAKDVLDRLGIKNDLPAPAMPAPDKSLDLSPDTSARGD